MSWLDKINTGLVITCGDGKSYTPNWVSTGKSVEYNHNEFTFNNVSGSLLIRKKPIGAKYPIRFYFQGENYLDTVKSFEASAANPNPWTLMHPLYGELNVQPTSLSFNDEAFNATEVSGTLVETISLQSITKLSVDAPTKILNSVEALRLTAAESAAVNIPILATKSKVSLQNDIMKGYSDVAGKIKSATDSTKYLNKFNESLGIINSPISDTLSIAKSVQEFSSMPIAFQDRIMQRLEMFKNQFDTLSNTVGNLFDRQSKKLYETNASSMVSGAVAAAVTDIQDDYNTSTGVLPVIEIINGMYLTFVGNIDVLQSSNPSSKESYVPDAGVLNELSQIVSFGIASLLSIASNAKQEREVILDKPSDPIKLTQKYYGLDEQDASLEFFVSTNGLSLDEYFFLDKGRKIKYYV